MNVITLLLSATSQGMLWSLLAIGVYMTFRILDIADLTAEEAFLRRRDRCDRDCEWDASRNRDFAGFWRRNAGWIGHWNLEYEIQNSSVISWDHYDDWFVFRDFAGHGCTEHRFAGRKYRFTTAQEMGLSKNNAVIAVGLLIVLLVILLLVLFSERKSV